MQSTEPLGFADLGLLPSLTETLAELGYEEPTPVQQQAIPLVLAGRDLLGQAATGTGKTAAFSLPLLQRLAASTPSAAPRALVLVPTRELAVQVAEAIHKYGRRLGTRVLPIFGGQPMGRQLQALQRGVDVVVATPGRALDHVRRGTLALDAVQVVVLDEADEMLDMGFAEDLDALLSATPETRQTLLFSATMPPRAAAIARSHLRDPARVEVAREPVAEGEAPRVRQVAYVVQRAHKAAALGRLLDLEDPGAALVFCRTRTEVDELAEVLSARGYRAEALHGGMSQEQRDRVMGRLRSGIADLVVATDVAARGIDVEQLTHVVNFDVPSAPETYVHRIGRVGRAGREGVAITLAEPREQRLLRNIEHHTRQKLALERLPTVADLRARRLELTRVAVREALLAGDFDRFRAVVEALSEEFDPLDVAAAAVQLVHRASVGPEEDEVEIPQPEPRAKRERPARAAAPADPSPSASGTVRLWVSLGREAGVSPRDLVGAITAEAGIPGDRIGAIEITDRFSFVEVDEAAAEDVLARLPGVRIRGRRVHVRRARPESRPPRRPPARR